jgi:hypothetical protein
MFYAKNKYSAIENSHFIMKARSIRKIRLKNKNYTSVDLITRYNIAFYSYKGTCLFFNEKNLKIKKNKGKILILQIHFSLILPFFDSLIMKKIYKTNT